jgi:hypothetical protein
MNRHTRIDKVVKVFEPRAIETVEHNGVTKRVTTINDLNARFALLEQDGSPSVYINRRDFLPIQDADLKRRLAGEVVAIGAKDGKPIYGSAFSFWTGHAARHLYRHVAFTNQVLPDDTLNLFRGLGITPKPGRCDKIIHHVQEVICSGSHADAAALLKLLAWQIQNIGKPSRIVVVLKSRKQQAGKGILLGELMAKIYGPSGFIAASADQILGRFNSAIRGRAFIFLDEVLFSGDRKAADGIKSLSTQTIIGIEEKGLPIVQCPVAVNLWLASNHENAAHVEEHDARYWPLEVSPHRVGDAAYFSELMQEIETGGGREAFAHYLLNLDVRDFVPSRDCPKDNAVKERMIRLSVNPFDARKWLEDCCHTERLIGRKLPDSEGWAEWREGEEYVFATLSAAYTEWQKTVKSPVAAKPTPIGNLGEVLSAAGVSIRRIGAGNRRILPAAVECLAALWRADDDGN